jgi:hypothetical protein
VIGVHPARRIVARRQRHHQLRTYATAVASAGVSGGSGALRYAVQVGGRRRRVHLRERGDFGFGADRDDYKSPA